MSHTGVWYRSPITLTALSLVVPPLGAAALWGTALRAWKKLLLTVLLLALTGVYLVVFFGLRVELSGGGNRPIFTFRNFERRMAALEQDRARQAQLSPPAAPAAAEPPPAPAPATEPAAEPVAAATAAPASTLPANSWTDFRGPQRDGIYRQGEILTTWPAAGLTRLWKQPIGGGYASFVVGEGRAYTIEQRRDKEAVVAYELATGRELWAHSYPAFFDESMGGPGPRATPTFHNGIVYSQGAAGDLRVLDARTGALKWSKNILTDNGAENVQWGMSASPLVVDGKVIVQPGGKNASIVAYPIDGGKPVWKSLSDAAAYVSPMLLTITGRRQIVTLTAKRLVGLDPSSGKLLWDYPWETMYDVNSTQPIPIGDNRLLISSGYGHGAALVEIQGAQGKTIWQNTRLKTRFASSVLRDGYVYGLDENILTCLRASDGNQMWKGGRYGYGQILLAGANLVVLSESGEVALVEATPDKHNEQAKFQAIEGKTWNHPVIEGGLLLVRNAAEMACFKIGR